jgi:hypothetical protein
MGMFDWFHHEDPSKQANKYLDQIPDKISPYYDPYSQAGQRQIPGLEEQFGNLINDPGSIYNKLGSGYQKSPGFDFAMKQALQGAGNAAAAGGMAGSPQHEQQNMELATNLANQDFNQYMQNVLGMYNTGLSGSQDIMGKGMNAGDAMAKMLAENMQNQASNAYSGAANTNRYRAGMLSFLSPGMGMMTNNFGQGGQGGNDQAQLMKMLSMAFG